MCFENLAARFRENNLAKLTYIDETAMVAICLINKAI